MDVSCNKEMRADNCCGIHLRGNQRLPKFLPRHYVGNIEENESLLWESMGKELVVLHTSVIKEKLENLNNYNV